MKALSIITLALLILARCSQVPGQSLSSAIDDFKRGQDFETSGDYSLAVIAYTRAGDAGEAKAYLRIAELYQSGKVGVATSRPEVAYQQSLPWYQKAAKAGDKKAIEFLKAPPDNADYLQGQKFEASNDYPLAFIVYKRAGDTGNGDAYLRIAKLYAAGKLGVSTSNSDAADQQSLAWFQQAAHLGNLEARKYLEQRDQTTEATRLSHVPQETSVSGSTEFVCSDTLRYLTTAIPTTSYAKLNTLRQQILDTNIRDVLSRMAGQHMSVDEAVQLANKQADADEANLPTIEQAIRASAPIGQADALVRGLRARDYSLAGLEDDVLGAAERAYIANDWGALANRETAKQLTCLRR